MSERLHDVYIGGKGYRLVDGINSFSSNIGTPLAAKVVTGDYSLADFDLYSVVAQSNFQGGLGLLNLTDVTRYAWGYRVDARGEHVTLGPKLDSTQPDSGREYTRSVSLLDVQVGLNYSIGNEPENQNNRWVELNPINPRVAIPFATAGGSPGPGPDPSFGPNDIDGLKLWLRADAGLFQDALGATPAVADSDPVGLWKDQSGHANDFLGAGSTCSLVADAQNGHPGVKGSGQTTGYLMGKAPVTGSSQRTIYVLCSVPALADDRAILDFGYQFGPWSGEDYMLTQFSSMWVEDGKRYWTTKQAIDTVEILMLRQVGGDQSDVEFWIDEVESLVQSTMPEPIDTAKNNDTATLFCRNAATKNSFGNVTILEILVYDSANSDADVANVHAYLRERQIAAASLTHPRKVHPSPRAGISDESLQRIWAYLQSDSKFTDASVLKFSIYTDASGVPDIAVANGEAIVDLSQIKRYGQWVSGSMDTLPVLDEVTAYWLVIDAEGLTDGETVKVLSSEHTYGTPFTYYVEENFNWFEVFGDTVLLLAQKLNSHPDTPVVKFMEWDGSVLGLAGKRLYRVVDVDTVEAVSDAVGIHSLPDDGTDLLVVHKTPDPAPSILFALGPDTPMQLWDGVETFTDLEATEHAERLCLYDNLWWRATQTDVDGVFVQGTKDYEDWALAGTAGERAKVGDSRFPIRQLFTWKGQLYAAKLDGLYVITYADTYPADGAKIQANRILSLESEINRDNFRAMAIWQEGLYFSLASGVAQFSAGNVFASVTPDGSLLETESTRGHFVGFLPTLNYLYAYYESDIGDWSQIMSFNGAWHSLMTMDRTGDLGGALFADSGLYGNFPRIWTSSMCAITSFVQPTWSSRRWTFGSGKADSEIKYFDRAAGGWMDECSGRLYSSWITGDLLNIIKDWVDLQVIVQNIDPNEFFIKVYYRFSETLPWVHLGDAKEEPVSILAFPNLTATTKIQLRFDFFTNESYSTPHLLGFALRYVPRPDTTELFGCQLSVSDELELRNNAIEPRSGADLWSDLKVARDADEAIEFVDISGIVRMVHVSSLSRQLKQRGDVNRTQTNDAYTVIIEMTEA